MAYWLVEYRHPSKGWIEISKQPNKTDAENYVKNSEESIIPTEDPIDRLFEKFSFRKVKGTLKENA